MGTRAVFTFKDDFGSHAVYKHMDGYPEGAADCLTKAIPFSWGLGRYEADDLSAAFVAANKQGGGDVYLSPSVDAHGDLDYHYELTAAKTNGQLIIRVFHNEVAFKEIFYGRLKDFVDTYGSSDTKKMWNELDKSPNKLYDGA